MGGSSSSRQYRNIAYQNEALANRAYDIGIPALKDQYALIDKSLSEGEPQYLKDAFSAQRAGLTDAAAMEDMALYQKTQAANEGAIQGGNTTAAIAPTGFGTHLAQALMSSRTQEGMAQAEQMTKLLGMGLGNAQQAGSGALGAAGNALQAAGSMAQYNPTYANIMGALSIGGSIYGGVNQARYTGGGVPAGGSPGTGGTWGASPWGGMV